jgi:hypothetical protein
MPSEVKDWPYASGISQAATWEAGIDLFPEFLACMQMIERNSRGDRI